MSKCTDLYCSISHNFHAIWHADARYACFRFNCVSCMSNALEARGSNLKHFGSHFDHFWRPFSCKQDPMCRPIENKAFASKEKRTKAEPPSCGRPYEGRMVLYQGHVASKQPPCHCKPKLEGHAASMRSHKARMALQVVSVWLLCDPCGLRASIYMPACLETIQGWS